MPKKIKTVQILEVEAPAAKVPAKRLPKVFVSVTPEFDERFTNWSKRLGVSKSQFGNMCLQAGMNSLIRAVAPEEAFTPEMLVKIIQEASKQNVQLDFGDFVPPEVPKI